jgi:hypothetical protein
MMRAEFHESVLRKESGMHSSLLGRFGRFIGWMALSCSIGLGISCGRKEPPVFEVRGQVLYEGKAVPHAFVALHPLEDSQVRAVRPSAATDKDGWFVLSSFHADDGAPAGDYAVTVEWRKTTSLDGDASVLSPNLLPAKYSKPATSGLRISVRPGKNEDQFLRLKR